MDVRLRQNGDAFRGIRTGGACRGNRSGRARKRANEVAAEYTGAVIEVASTPEACLKGVDVIYTDVWASMGEEAEIPERVKHADSVIK